MIFADKRYARQDKRGKLPQWISRELSDANANLSTDMVIGLARRFFRQMGQPANEIDAVGHALWSAQEIRKQEDSRYQSVMDEDS